MTNMHSKVSRFVLLALLVIVLYIFWAYSYRAPGRESVIYTRTDCIQSVCVDNKTTGELCAVRKPTVSELIIEADPNNYNVRNIRVIPSDDLCQ